ncbi:MAG: SPOR domain-containing protein [Methylophilales bacterium]|nr:SPOR domain-containing protein [Methylophilales bacterium]
MAAEQLTDQEKLFRVRARRRLIGAVALVLLMLTILPMLLDDRSNQKMPASDVAISIPSQDDGNFSSKIVPVAPAPVKPATPEAPAKTEAIQSPVETPSVVETKPAEPAPVVEKPTKPEPKPEAKPEPKPPAKVEAAAEVSKEAKKTGVSVQVGVISDGEKVQQVINKIEGLGLKANTENLNTPTGVKVRIRCGPYPSKEEAEKALETLKSGGFKPILVVHK